MSPDRGPAPDRRFPAAEHLRTRSAFQAVFHEGTAYHGKRLVLFILRNESFPRQIGIVAGRKVGGAVHRNRSKRLLREAYRHLREHLPTNGFRMVLVARRGCHEARMQDVLGELEGSLDRAGLIDPPTTTSPPSS